MDINDIKAGWIADEIMYMLGYSYNGPKREIMKQTALKELTLLEIDRLDSEENPRIYVLKSRHSDVKQCFFDWGSFGTGIPEHIDTPEYYGRDLEVSSPNPDEHLWEWRLTQKQMEKIIGFWANYEPRQGLKGEEGYSEMMKLRLTMKLVALITASMV